jgi:hypothetical protein
MNPFFSPPLIVVAAAPALDPATTTNAITAGTSSAITSSVAGAAASLAQSAIIIAPPPVLGGHDPSLGNQVIDQVLAPGPSVDLPVPTITALPAGVSPILGKPASSGAATGTDSSANTAPNWSVDPTVADWLWPATRHHKGKAAQPAVNMLIRRQGS